MLKDNARIDLARRKVLNALNEANLPVYVLEFIVGDLYAELQKQRIVQVKQEESDYIKEVEAARKGNAELTDAGTPALGEALPARKERVAVPLSAIKDVKERARDSGRDLPQKEAD